METYLEQPIARIPNRDDGFATLWRAVRGHKSLFAAITLVFVTAGASYVLVVTPQYRADALLRLQNTPSSSISALSAVAGATTPQQSANDETAILTSRSIVSEAIEKTGAEVSVKTESYFPLIGRFIATRNRYADELAQPVLGMTRYAWGGEKLEVGTFVVPEVALGRNFRVVAGVDGAWTLLDDSDTELAKGHVGETVDFMVTSPDGSSGPGKLRIAALRARSGIEFRLRRQPLQTVYENVIKQLKASVPTSQNPQERDPSVIRLSYQADSPDAAKKMVNAVMNAFLTRDVALRAEQAKRSLDFLRGRLPGLKRDLEASEDRLNDYRTKMRVIDVDQQGAALVSRMNSLADRRTALELLLEDRKQLFQPDNPAYQVAQSQLAQVKREMQEASNAAEQLPSVQREFVRLARDVSVNTQLYTSVLTNAQQLEVAAASTAPGISVVDWAIAPDKQSWPRNWMVMLGSLLTGLLAASVTVHLLSRSRRQLVKPEELDGLSVLPRLAVVSKSVAQLKSDVAPHRLPGQSKLLAMSDPMDPSIEGLRSLRSSLRPLLADASGEMKHKIVAFTGPTRGVGKSFVASNFAYLLTEIGASVLLIDADLRKGKLKHMFETRENAGLSDVLEGSASIDDAIVKFDESGLSMLSAGTFTPANPSEMLVRPAFRQLLESLRERYDFIVLDTPPVLPVSDALLIAEQGCDVVLLVSRAEVTGAGQLDETLRRLHQAGAKVGGHVFNGFDPGRFGEGEQYGLYFGRKGGGYF
ncbi:polysaccharide biosynthesis tyrosine autokinase [Paraburkholderia mimosarum]|uniref:polysaccharide biosynthesis tyrosine autokinase n=1 Tax=Paraburkholderia mimosarum TaxID=312026 RepID=UPI00138E22A8|nr:polysaccharide biosynthesis tyrosine autokinase [Paraburkholderia mimosarum]